jgi:hypothetical protein
MHPRLCGTCCSHGCASRDYYMQFYDECWHPKSLEHPRCPKDEYTCRFCCGHTECWKENLEFSDKLANSESALKHLIKIKCATSKGICRKCQKQIFIEHRNEGTRVVRKAVCLCRVLDVAPHLAEVTAYDCVREDFGPKTKLFQCRIKPRYPPTTKQASMGTGLDTVADTAIPADLSTTVVVPTVINTPFHTISGQGLVQCGDPRRIEEAVLNMRQFQSSGSIDDTITPGYIIDVQTYGIQNVVGPAAEWLQAFYRSYEGTFKIQYELTSNAFLSGKIIVFTGSGTAPSPGDTVSMQQFEIYGRHTTNISENSMEILIDLEDVRQFGNWVTMDASSTGLGRVPFWIALACSAKIRSIGGDAGPIVTYNKYWLANNIIPMQPKVSDIVSVLSTKFSRILGNSYSGLRIGDIFPGSAIVVDGPTVMWQYGDTRSDTESLQCGGNSSFFTEGALIVCNPIAQSDPPIQKNYPAGDVTVYRLKYGQAYHWFRRKYWECFSENVIWPAGYTPTNPSGNSNWWDFESYQDTGTQLQLIPEVIVRNTVGQNRFRGFGGIVTDTDGDVHQFVACSYKEANFYSLYGTWLQAGENVKNINPPEEVTAVFAAENDRWVHPNSASFFPCSTIALAITPSLAAAGRPSAQFHTRWSRVIERLRGTHTYGVIPLSLNGQSLGELAVTSTGTFVNSQDDYLYMAPAQAAEIVLGPFQPTSNFPNPRPFQTGPFINRISGQNTKFERLRLYAKNKALPNTQQAGLAAGMVGGGLLSGMGAGLAGYMQMRFARDLLAQKISGEKEVTGLKASEARKTTAANLALQNGFKGIGSGAMGGGSGFELMDGPLGMSYRNISPAPGNSVNRGMNTVAPTSDVGVGAFMPTINTTTGTNTTAMTADVGSGAFMAKKFANAGTNPQPTTSNFGHHPHAFSNTTATQSGPLSHEVAIGGGDVRVPLAPAKPKGTAGWLEQSPGPTLGNTRNGEVANAAGSLKNVPKPQRILNPSTAISTQTMNPHPVSSPDSMPLGEFDGSESDF